MSQKERLNLIKRGNALLDQGLSPNEIAHKLQISRTRVGDLLSNEAGVQKLEEAKRERENFRRHRDKKIWELKAKGMTQRDIAELLGISQSSIRAVLDSNKVKADKLTTIAVEGEQLKRKENRERAGALKDKGLNNKQIAEEMGKSESWVMITLGVSRRNRPWPIERRRECIAEYKKLLAEGKTTDEAAKIVGANRGTLHNFRLQIEEEERVAFEGTKGQYEKMRQKERCQFTEARKKEARKMKKAEEDEAEKKIGERNRAYGYLRVSSQEQVQKGISLKGYQVELIKEYAEKNGYRLIGMLADEGMHGDDYNRPQLQELMKKAENDEFDYIIVWMLDRLMRESYQQQKIMFEVFDPCGVDVKSTTQEMDRSTPHGKLLFTILGGTNQYELDLIKQRAKVASDHVWSKGEWKAPSAVPLGFRMDKSGKYLEYEEDGMRKLKRIYRLINESRGKIATHPGYMSYEQIARECGVGKGKVFKLSKTTLKEYIGQYKGFMGNDE